MTETQFSALAQLMRLRAGPAKEAAKLVLVHKIRPPAAAKAVGMDYRAATYAVKRVRAGLELAKQATIQQKNNETPYHSKNA